MQNPLTLNRYLYANANPATLVDPDGHSADPVCKYGREDCQELTKSGWKAPVPRTNHVLVADRQTQGYISYLTDSSGKLIADINSVAFENLWRHCDPFLHDNFDPMCSAAQKLVEYERAGYKIDRQAYCDEHENCLAETIRQYTELIQAVDLTLLGGPETWSDAGEAELASGGEPLLGGLSAANLRGMDPRTRGLLLEDEFLPAAGRLPTNYKALDYAADGVAIQNKSMDLSFPSYAEGKNIYSAGKEWVDDLSSIPNDAVLRGSGKTVDMASINTRILQAEYVIPAGGVIKAQQDQIDKLIEYAATKDNVETVIIMIH